MGSRSHRISVVIPAYNAEHSIAKAIESVLAQDLPPSEIVVVDDGSQDGTGGIVRRYEGKVRYIHQANGGSSAARNRGISESSHQWIAFLDADDRWRPEKLQRQFELVDRGLPIQWLAGAYTVEREELSLSPATSHRGPAGVICEGMSFDALELMAAGWAVWTGTVVVHRDVLQAVGDFDVAQRTSHDTDLWIRIAAAFPGIGYIAEPIAFYHANNPGSLATTAHAQHDLSQLLLYERAMQTAAQLPRQRRQLISKFLKTHANSAVKTALWEGRQSRATWLLERFTGLNIEMSSWLRIAARIPPLFLVPAHRSFRLLSGRALRARLPMMQ